MKKLFTTLFASAYYVGSIVAQACGTNGPGVCTPQGGPAGGGFGDVNTFACAEQGVAYDYSIQFTMFSSFTFQGTQSVDSIEFVSLENLPCGLCWAVNEADKRYNANQDGCIRITGTTNDPAGQYKLSFALKAWINGTPVGLNVPASLTEQAGIKLYLRVKAQGSNCPNADTTSAFQGNLTATTGCPVSVNDVNSVANNVAVFPNPMTTYTTVSFTTEQSENVTVSLVDVTGKILLQQTVETVAGENTTRIEQANLANGVYFIQISNGKSTVSKKLTVNN